MQNSTSSTPALVSESTMIPVGTEFTIGRQIFKLSAALTVNFSKGHNNAVTAKCSYHTAHYSADGSTPEDATAKLVQIIYNITTARVSELSSSMIPDSEAIFAAKFLSPVSLVEAARKSIARDVDSRAKSELTESRALIADVVQGKSEESVEAPSHND